MNFFSSSRGNVNWSGTSIVPRGRKRKAWACRCDRPRTVPTVGKALCCVNCASLLPWYGTYPVPRTSHFYIRGTCGYHLETTTTPLQPLATHTTFAHNATYFHKTQPRLLFRPPSYQASSNPTCPGFQVSKGEVLFITDSLGRLRKNDKISLQAPPPPPSHTFFFFPLGDTIYGIIKRMLRSTAHSLVPPRRWSSTL